MGPGPAASNPETVPRVFSHELFDGVLKRFVNDAGLVNYRGLADNPADLDAYLALLASISPDSQPESFPTSEDRLAYWINAYNASVIKIVLTYYPISSVTDVKPPTLLSFFGQKSGFFFFQRLTYGGKPMSLHDLEKGIIRKRFSDPRVHFALNSASMGCPRLPNEVFLPHHLEAQLGNETLVFLSERRNLRLDSRTNILYMSSILHWYKDDFLDWCGTNLNKKDPTLVDYVLHFAPKRLKQEIESAKTPVSIKFIPYDWRLNDQASMVGR